MEDQLLKELDRSLSSDPLYGSKPKVPQVKTPQVLDNEDSFLDNLGEGFEQGGKGLVSGGAYALGELSTYFTKDDDYGERLKQWAQEYQKTAPEADDSWGQFLGSLVPSMIPTAGALGATVVSGGLAGPAALAASGALGASSMGQGMMEYDRYQESKGRDSDDIGRLATGLAYGAAEFLPEFLGLKALSPSVAGRLAFKGNTQMAENAGKSIIANYMKANPKQAAKLLPTILKGSAVEGGQESVTEALTTLTDFAYKDLQDMPDAGTLAKNIGKAALGGSIMGTGMGALSYKAQNVAERRRRKENGRVILAEVPELGTAGEVIGQNKEGNYDLLMPDGSIESYSEASLGRTVDLTPDQFDNILKGKREYEQEVEKELATREEQQIEQEKAKLQALQQYAIQTENGPILRTGFVNGIPVFVTDKRVDPNKGSQVYVFDANNINSQPVAVRNGDIVDKQDVSFEEYLSALQVPNRNTDNPITRGETIVKDGVEFTVTGINRDERVVTIKNEDGIYEDITYDDAEGFRQEAFSDPTLSEVENDLQSVTEDGIGAPIESQSIKVKDTDYAIENDELTQVFEDVEEANKVAKEIAKRYPNVEPVVENRTDPNDKFAEGNFVIKLNDKDGQAGNNQEVEQPEAGQSGEGTSGERTNQPSGNAGTEPNNGRGGIGGESGGVLSERGESVDQGTITQEQRELSPENVSQSSEGQEVRSEGEEEKRGDQDRSGDVGGNNERTLDSAEEVNETASSSLNRTASWVVIDKKTGKAVQEIQKKSIADKVDRNKFDVVPIQEYLGNLNETPKGYNADESSQTIPDQGQQSPQAKDDRANEGDAKAEPGDQKSKPKARSKARKVGQNKDAKKRSPRKTKEEIAQFEEKRKNLAEQYVQERESPSHLSTNEAAIWSYGPFHVTRNSFINQSDKNNITEGLAKAYFRKDAQNVDQIADQISESMFGDTGYITPQDIVDFMVRFPGNADSSKVKISDVARGIESEYKELTGKGINIRIAQNLVTNPLLQKTERTAEEMADLPFQLKETGQASLFSGQATGQAQTKRDKLQSDLDRSAKRLRELNKKPAAAKSNLVLEEIEALKKDIVRINSQINNAMMRGEATKGGEQTMLFKFADPNQTTQSDERTPQAEGATRANVASRIFNPFKAPQKPKVEKMVNKIIQKENWKNAPEVVVWESMLDFIVNNPEISYQITSPGAVTGFWWENDGRVHIIADHNHFSGGFSAVENTILHEAVGHYGLRGLMEQISGKQGEYKKELDTLLDEIFDTYSQDMGDLSRLYFGKGVDKLSKAEQRVLSEEYFAHQAQEGIEPSLNDKFIQWLRKVWEQLTGQKSKLDDITLRNIIGNSRKYLKVGDNYINRANFRKGVRELNGDIQKQIVETPKGNFGIGSFVKGGNTYIHATKDNEIVGSAMFASDGEAMAVDVDPEFQRLGIATAMYEHAKNRGVNIKPGQIQTDEGKAFNDSLSFQKISKFEDYEIQAEQEGEGVRGTALQKAARDSFQSAFNAIGRGTETVEANEQIKLQHQNAKEYAQSNNLIIDKLSDLGVETDVGGMENKIAINVDKGEIYKSNNLFVHKGDILSYINYIQRHNHLFPNTAYELVGFQEITKNKELWMKPIVKQTFVADARKATQEEIDAGMKARGYYSNDRNSFSYENGVFEISDLKPANVLFKDGEIFVIDNVTKRFSEGDLMFQIAPQTDSKEFKNWFKDSKVVDESGEPLVVYHGTERGGFTEFDQYEVGQNTGNASEGFYFSDDRSNAISYAGESGDLIPATAEEIFNNPSLRGKLSITDHGDGTYSMSDGKWDVFTKEDQADKDELIEHIEEEYVNSRGGIYPVYLSIQNPYIVDFEGRDWTGAKEGEYDGLQQSIPDLENEAIQMGADGLIIQNVVDEGRHGRGYNGPQTTYVVFDPTQIKSATSNVGTFDSSNPDIRFQIKKPVEQSGELIAMHNLSIKSLKNIDKIGGLPMPSIAITKSSIPFESFGDVSLIADKSMIDPKGRGNRVFGADAYSPRYPKVDYFPNRKKVEEAFDKYIDDVPVGISSSARHIVDMIVTDGYDYAKQEPLTQIAYLKEKGRKIPKLNKIPKPKVSKSLVDYYNKKNQEDSQWRYHEYKFDPEFQKLVKQAKKDEYKDAIWQRLYGGKEDLDPHLMSHVMKDIEKATNGRDEFDTVTFRAELRKKTSSKDFNDWFDSKMDDLNIEEKLFAGFTPSGTRKYLPHTVENVIKLMRRESVRGGEAWNYGVGSLRAKITPEFKSLQQIRNASDKLVEKEEFEKIKEEISSEYSNLIDEWRKNDPHKSDNMFDDRMSYMLQEAAVIGLPRSIKEYGIDIQDISQDLLDKTKSFFNKLVGFPTEYFEAKPNRAVPLSEFRLAAIPKGTSKDVRDILQKNGIKAVTYDRSVKGDRQEKLNRALDQRSNSDIRFQLKEDPRSAHPEPVDNFYSNSLNSLRNISQGKATPDQWKAMLLKNGGSQAELDWIGFDSQFANRKSVSKDELYDFIAENQIEVVDVMKGLVDPIVLNIESDEKIWYVDFEDDQIQVLKKDAKDEASAIILAKRYYQNVEDQGGDTKYSNYTLPGGENYKELLLTMASKPTLPNGWRVEFDEPRSQYLVYDNSDTLQGASKTKEDAISRSVSSTNQYKSSHWDEPGILSHIRFDEREVNGEKVLFINELQSDWSQEGRKKGFKTGVGPLGIVQTGDSFKVIKTSDKSTLKEGFKTIDEARDFVEANSDMSKVPQMPFKNTSQWLNLSIRRMVRYASENNFDRIAFITGEQAADLYDLSKQVDVVNWNTNTNRLYVQEKGSREEKKIADNVTEDNISDYIGKEVAEKLINQESNVTERTVSGVDLQVGGEGMKSFYNKIVPSTTSKLLKKLDKGAKVEPVEIQQSNTPLEIKQTQDKVGWEVSFEGQTRLFTTKEKAEDFVRENSSFTQLSFPITPKMRKQSMELGMPMFQLKPTVAATKQQISNYHLNTIRNFQDRMIDVRLLQQDKTVYDDSMDPYTYDNLSSGIVNEETRKFRIEKEKPLVEAIKKTGKDFDEISRYLKAKHIVEDKIEQGGIPMEEAQSIVDAFEGSVKPDRLVNLQNKVQDIVKWTNEYNLKMGMITPAKFESNAKNKFYVPLRGFIDREDKTVVTRDFRRKGRTSESGDPIAYLMGMAETAILKGQQNKTRQMMLNFIEANPDPSLYKIKNGWYIKQTKEDGTEKWVETSDKPGPDYKEKGMVKRDVNPEIDEVEYLEDKVRPVDLSRLSVMVGGRKVFIEFIGDKGKRIADAFGKQKVDTVPKLFSYLGKYSRFLTNFYTKYSPEFAFRNFIRDMTTGMINLRTDHGTKTTTEALSQVPSSLKSLRSFIIKGTFSDKYIREFVENGGLTGYSDMKDIATRQKELEQTIKGLKGNKFQWTEDMFTNKLLKPIDDINRMFENGMRLSAYKTLRKKGVSPQKAAIYAKDLTVNFNRKGNWSSNLGALYLFFNASVQGTERLLRPFGGSLYNVDRKTRRRAIQTALALPTMAFALSMINRAMAGKDEDDEYYYDKLPDYTRQHNILIPNFATGKEGDFIQIPLPYGYNVFFAVSDHIGRALLGKETSGHAALNTMSVMMESFSPIGGVDFAQEGMTWEEGVMRLATPTPFDPVMDLLLNKNFAGMPIYQETFPGQTPEPDSQRYFSNVNPIFKSITSLLNEYTGGSEIESGGIDINPETIEHFSGTIFGGVGTFINNIFTSGANLLSGENPISFEDDRLKKVPFVRNYVTYPSDYVDQTRFYNFSTEVKTAEDIYDRYRKSGNRKDAMSFRKENAPKFKMAGMTDATAKRAKDLRDRIRTLKAIPGAEMQVQKLEKELNALFVRYNKKFENVTNAGEEIWLAELLGL